MKQFNLPRDGRLPLRFTGTVLAESAGHFWRGREHNRYYNLTLYETKGGRFVVHWNYRTQWEGEDHHSDAQECASLVECAIALEEFDPTFWVVAFKPVIASYRGHEAGEEYTARQKELERGIKERYRAQVSELCQTLDVAEEIE